MRTTAEQARRIPVLRDAAGIRCFLVHLHLEAAVRDRPSVSTTAVFLTVLRVLVAVIFVDQGPEFREVSVDMQPFTSPVFRWRPWRGCWAGMTLSERRR